MQAQIAADKAEIAQKLALLRPDPNAPVDQNVIREIDAYDDVKGWKKPYPVHNSGSSCSINASLQLIVRVAAFRKQISHTATEALTKDERVRTDNERLMVLLKKFYDEHDAQVRGGIATQIGIRLGLTGIPKGYKTWKALMRLIVEIPHYRDMIQLDEGPWLGAPPAIGTRYGLQVCTVGIAFHDVYLSNRIHPGFTLVGLIEGCRAPRFDADFDGGHPNPRRFDNEDMVLELNHAYAVIADGRSLTMLSDKRVRKVSHQDRIRFVDALIYERRE